MSQSRQKSIALTSKEKDELEIAKQAYEHKIGDKGDWGAFLVGVAALGLAALGVYKLIKANKRKPVVKCPACGDRFPIAHIGELQGVVYIACPNPKCGEELVVDFSEP